jgi:hypothetical protein
MNRFLLFSFSLLIVLSSCQKKVSEPVPDPTNPTNPTNPTTPTTASLAVSRSSISVGSFSGYTDTLTIQSTVDWTITLSSGTSAWLSLDTLKGGNGSKIVKLSIIANNTATSQTGTITISPVGSSAVTPQVITITQNVYSLLWQKMYGTSIGNVVLDITETGDGGYVFAGATGNGWIFKTDANGNKLWEFTSSGVDDQFNTVTTTTDGGYVAAGHRYRKDVSGALTYTDILLVKLNASGSKVWEKTYGGSYNESAYKILKIADGGYVLAGSVSSSDGDIPTSYGGHDMLLLKLDANGNKVWSKNYGGSKHEFFATLAATADGGYLLTGTTESNDGDVSGSHGSDDALVLKLDVNGNKLWSKTFGGSKGDGSRSIITTKDGGSIIVGYTNSSDGDVSGTHGSEDDVWLLKLDNNGQKTWQATLGGTDSDNGISIAALSDGSYMVLGQTFSNDGDVTENHGNADFWMVKVSSAGKKLWQKTFGSSYEDRSYAFTVTTDGNFLAAGIAFDSNNYGKGWVLKLK